MISELSQPLLSILIGDVLGNVIDQEGANSSSVIGTCDGSISFLACGVPNLRLDRFIVNLNAPLINVSLIKKKPSKIREKPNGIPCGKLDAYGRLALQIELVARKSGQQIRFADARVTNKHHFKQVIVLVIPLIHFLKFYSKKLHQNWI